MLTSDQLTTLRRNIFHELQENIENQDIDFLEAVSSAITFGIQEYENLLQEIEEEGY